MNVGYINEDDIASVLGFDSCDKRYDEIVRMMEKREFAYEIHNAVAYEVRAYLDDGYEMKEATKMAIAKIARERFDTDKEREE